MTDQLVLDREKAVERTEELRREIEHHRFLYYVLDRPELSDTDFDRMYRELQELEQLYPDLMTPTSPTQKVGYQPSTDFKQIKHRVPLLSLANAMGNDDLDRWNERLLRQLDLPPGESAQIEFVCELKIDGLSIAITYKDGKFVEGATRGNGETGEDVTLNLRTVAGLPRELKPKEGFTVPKMVEVRGEVYMPISNFNQLNSSLEEDGDQTFANPRNAAAGSLRQKDPRVTAKRKLALWTYGIYVTDPVLKDPDTHQAAMELLEGLGLPVNANRAAAQGIDEVKQFCADWDEKRHGLDYQTDGVVIKVNNRKLWDQLGTTAHSPRWAVAFKYPPDEVETVVEDVEFDVGRIGTVTPVACLRPVKLAGSTVRRATLHNFDQVRRLDVRVGDTVVIRKAAEIIPEVLRVIHEKRPASSIPIHEPEGCPICSGTLERLANEVALKCTNYSCPARVKRRLSHWVSRDAMDIDGLGEVIVKQLVETGFVTDTSDLYMLTEEKLMSLERMGKKSAEKLINAINASRTRPQACLIHALGIRHVGSRMSEILAEHFGGLEAVMNAELTALEKIEGVGPQIAAAIVQFLSDPDNIALIRRLEERGIKLQADADERGPQFEQTLAGKTFVITGTLSMERSDAEKQIKARGGKPTSSVSKKTDYVVVGANPGSKFQKAQELGITVLDEEAFRKILAGET